MSTQRTTLTVNIEQFFLLLCLYDADRRYVLYGQHRSPAHLPLKIVFFAGATKRRLASNEQKEDEMLNRNLHLV